MATKAEMYREMADHATEKLTAQVTEWIKFLLMAGRLHKYESFLDLSMVYMQKSTSSAIAEYETWPRIGRYVRCGAKGIALLRYRNGRAFLRYVFDVSDTGRREDGRDPVLWQYREEYESAVTAHLEECFKVPGPAGLAKQLVALAIQFADARWHDFHDRIMLSLRDSAMDGMDEDNAGLRFRNAVTVSLSFLLLARCGFDLDSYFTPEDFAGINDFDTKDAVLALGSAVSESAGVILRQVEGTVKVCMSGRAADRPELDAALNLGGKTGQEQPAA